jgi:hypothetical protein
VSIRKLLPTLSLSGIPAKVVVKVVLSKEETFLAPPLMFSMSAMEY